MIRTDEDLAFVREQLARLERALQDLEDNIRPKSEKWFRLMSEGFLDEITKLRGEIAEYRAAKSTRAGPGARPERTAKRRPA